MHATRSSLRRFAPSPPLCYSPAETLQRLSFVTFPLTPRFGVISFCQVRRYSRERPLQRSHRLTYAHCQTSETMPASTSTKPPSRAGSDDSTFSRGERQQHRRGDLAAALNEDIPSSSRDSLPPYEEIDKTQYRVAEKGSAPAPDATGPPPPLKATGDSVLRLSLPARIIWPIALLIPLGTAGALLYLVTCSSDSMRPDFGVVNIAVPPDVFDPLFQAASSMVQIGSQGSNASSLDGASSSGLLSFKRQTNVSGGDICLGMWGWCLRTDDAQQ